MPRLLSNSALDKIRAQDVRYYLEFTINGVSFLSDFASYNYNTDKQFSAHYFSINIKNDQGKNHPNRNTNVQKGNEVILKEGIMQDNGSVDLFTNFTGIIREITPSVNAGGDSQIELKVYDSIIRLQDLELNYRSEASKTAVSNQDIRPNFISLDSGTGTWNQNYIEDLSKSWDIGQYQDTWILDSNGIPTIAVVSNTATRLYLKNHYESASTTKPYTLTEGLSQVFDFPVDNIANSPLPIIRIRDKIASGLGLQPWDAPDEVPTAYDGFEIKYDVGQIIFGRPLDMTSHKIETDYSYYPTGMYVEDELENIITRPDGYNASPFVASTHLRDNFQSYEGLTQDTLIPNYFPDTDPDIYTRLTENLNTGIQSGTVLSTSSFVNYSEVKIGDSSATKLNSPIRNVAASTQVVPAQEFKMFKTDYLRTVAVSMRRSNVAASTLNRSIYLQLHPDDGTGQPDQNTVLARSTFVPYSDITNSAFGTTLYYFSFLNPYLCVGNVTYYLIFYVSDQSIDTANYIDVGRQGISYANGKIWFMSTLIDACDVTTGWAGFYGTETAPSLDTIDFKEGVASINLGKSGTDGTSGAYLKTITAFNITGLETHAWVYISADALSKLTDLTLYFGTSDLSWTYNKAYLSANLATGWNYLGDSFSNWTPSGSVDPTNVTMIALFFNTGDPLDTIASGDIKMDAWHNLPVTTYPNIWTSSSGNSIVMTINPGNRYLQVNQEIMRYDDAANNIFSGLYRGQLGSIAQSHSKSDKVYPLYPAGELWYLTYNNLTSSIPVSGLADSLVQTSAPISFNQRYGSFRLSEPISLNTSVTMSSDYQFKTLQATGIQVNKLTFRDEETQNRFDAISRIKELLPPNYILRTEGDNKIRGSFLNQKFTPDYTIGDYSDFPSMRSSYSYTDSPDVFTRVKLFGENNNPVNVFWENRAKVINYKTFSGTVATGFLGNLYDSAQNWTNDEWSGYTLRDALNNYFYIYQNDSKHLMLSGMPATGKYEISRMYVGEAFDQELLYLGMEGNYALYTPGLNSVAGIITNYPDTPKIYVNGVQLDGPEPVPIGPVPINLITDTTVITTQTTGIWSGETDVDTKVSYNYLVVFPHSDIVENIYALTGWTTEDDIFVYEPGLAGGGIKASIQIFPQSTDVKLKNGVVWAGNSILDPMFTLPISSKDVDYRRGLWFVRNSYAYTMAKNSLMNNILSTDTSIDFIFQTYEITYTYTWKKIHDPTVFESTTRHFTYEFNYPSKPGTFVPKDQYGNSIKTVDLQANYEFNAGKGVLGIIFDANQAINTTLTIGQKLWAYNFTWETTSKMIEALKFQPQEFVVGSPDQQIAILDGQYGNYEYIAYTGVSAKTLLSTKTFNLSDYYSSDAPLHLPTTTKNRISMELIVKTNKITLSGVTRGAFGTTAQTWEAKSTIDALNNIGTKTIIRQKKIYYDNFPPGAQIISLSNIGSAIYYVWHKSNIALPSSSGNMGSVRLLSGNGLYDIYDASQLWNINQWLGYYLYDKNGDKFYIDSNTSTHLYVRGQPAVGSYQIKTAEGLNGEVDFMVDHDRNIFKVHKNKLAYYFTFPTDMVKVDFKYTERVSNFTGIDQMFDGRWNTQGQQIFYTEPVKGRELFVIDIGSVVDIDAIDITGGYFQVAGNNAGIQISFTNQYTLEVSDNNVTYTVPSDKAAGFSLSSGQTFTLEREDLGQDFQTRYLRLSVDKIQKLDYGKGVWCIAFSEFRAYAKTIIKGEATLIARSDSGTAGVGSASTMTDTSKTWTVNQYVGYYMVDKYGYEFYIQSNTANALTVDGTPASGLYYIFATKETENTLYDKFDLRTLLGDKLYKRTEIVKYLDTQEKADRESKDLLKEYTKNHTTATVTIVTNPAIKMGQTVRMTDNINAIDKNYLVEGVQANGPQRTLTLTYYP